MVRVYQWNHRDNEQTVRTQSGSTSTTLADSLEPLGNTLMTEWLEQQQEIRQAREWVDATKPVTDGPYVPDHIYDWLVRDLGFPFDISTQRKPGWLDLDRLSS